MHYYNTDIRIVEKTVSGLLVKLNKIKLCACSMCRKNMVERILYDKEDAPTVLSWEKHRDRWKDFVDKQKC